MPHYPIEDLYRITSAKVATLQKQGYFDQRDIPDGILTHPIQQRMLSAARCRGAVVMAGFGALALGQPKPWGYLDFETIGFPPPSWKGTRPNQQIPFQWSLHLEDGDGGHQHRPFLDVSGGDPRRGCAEALLRETAEAATLWAWHAPFEQRVVADLAQDFPDLAEGLKGLRAKIQDLLPPVRNHYYHPAMRGSFSLKAVTPCLAPELSYLDLEGVQYGAQAQQAYLEIIHPHTNTVQRRGLIQALERYCALDTWATVRIMEEMLKLDAGMGADGQ